MFKFLPILITVLIAFNLSAQEGFYFGGSITPSSSLILNQNAWNEPTDPQPELEYRFTVTARPAISLGYHIKPKFSIETEVGYIKLGQRYEGQQFDLPTTRKVRMDYIQWPIFFKYTSVAPVVRFHFMAGPQLGFLLHASEDKNREGSPAYIYEDKDVTSRFNKLDVGVTLQIGADIPVTDKLMLIAGLRLYTSVIDINEERWQLPNFERDVYEKSFNSYAGVNLGLQYYINTTTAPDKPIEKEMYEY